MKSLNFFPRISILKFLVGKLQHLFSSNSKNKTASVKTAARAVVEPGAAEKIAHIHKTLKEWDIDPSAIDPKSVGTKGKGIWIDLKN